MSKIRCKTKLLNILCVVYNMLVVEAGNFKEAKRGDFKSSTTLFLFSTPVSDHGTVCCPSVCSSTIASNDISY